MSSLSQLDLIAKIRCEDDPLFFTRYFFKERFGIKFKVNWHHRLISDKLQGIIEGKIKHLAISVPPGSSKTEMVVINFIARGIALNPRARFLHLSGSESLALLNSSTARDIIRSDAFQKFWPLKIGDDSQQRWNVMLDENKAGGVYATSLGGQVTGFRAGHMTEGFQGCIIIDDPVKPEGAYSQTKMEVANRILINTVKSRKANPDTPLVLIMQRIAENDPIGFLKSGNIGNDWIFIEIPALIDDNYVDLLPEKYRPFVEKFEVDTKGRFSYWPYKEKIDDLLAMESGQGKDQSGSRVSRQVFSAQYQQNPVAIGGNIIHSNDFKYYTVLPLLKYRKIYADTAQKTKQSNDFSVFECWGYGVDGNLYLVDLIRGKWEAPELQKRALGFWQKHLAFDHQKFGHLREMIVEDKVSGTGLIQTLLLPPYSIPIKGIERNIDKLTRVMDALPYIESGLVYLPQDAYFTSDFIAEAESFSADDSHPFDDQIDPMVDAILDMASWQNKVKMWEALA